MSLENSLKRLIEFLRSHPESAKFLPSLLKEYASLQESRQVKHLNGDPVSQQIYQFLLSQLVINQEDLTKIFRLTREEIRGRMSFIQSQLHEVEVDRTNPDNWVIYFKEEALING